MKTGVDKWTGGQVRNHDEGSIQMKKKEENKLEES
jgi:hypothetical protein